LDEREKGQLQRVVTLLSRPVRIVKNQPVSPQAVDKSLFEVEEERALHSAAQVAAAQIKPGMSIPEFLQVSRASNLYWPLLLRCFSPFVVNSESASHTEPDIFPDILLDLKSTSRLPYDDDNLQAFWSQLTHKT
jgi:glycyl-tRNA synthetase beta subunit